MTGKLKFRFLTVFIILMSVSVYASRWGKVSYILGGVTVIRKGQERPAKLNASIMTGDIIQTEAESSIDIVHNSDGVTIKLTENSKLEIQNKSGEEDTYAKVLEGEIIGNIKKMMATRHVQFATPTATATIRGTALSMRYVPSSKLMEFNLFSGNVFLKVGPEALDLKAGDRVIAIGSQIQRMLVPKKEIKRIKKKSGKVLDGVNMPEGESESLEEGKKDDGAIEDVEEVKSGEEDSEDESMAKSTEKDDFPWAVFNEWSEDGASPEENAVRDAIANVGPGKSVDAGQEGAAGATGDEGTGTGSGMSGGGTNTSAGINAAIEENIGANTALESAIESVGGGDAGVSAAAPEVITRDVIIKIHVE